MELAERVGPDVDYWLDAAYVFALWTWLQLHELDRRREFVTRIGRIRLAQFVGMSMTDDGFKLLREEEATAIAEAAPEHATEAAYDATVERGRRMLDDMQRGFRLDPDAVQP